MAIDHLKNNVTQSLFRYKHCTINNNLYVCIIFSEQRNCVFYLLLYYISSNAILFTHAEHNNQLQLVTTETFFLSLRPPVFLFVIHFYQLAYIFSSLRKKMKLQIFCQLLSYHPSHFGDKNLYPKVSSIFFTLNALQS